jgi:hypothetical protein
VQQDGGRGHCNQDYRQISQILKKLLHSRHTLIQSLLLP